MTGPLHPAYRFATEAQWRACYFTGADRRTAEDRKGLRPFAPYGLPPVELWAGSAFAPAFGDAAELVWHDDSQGFWRLAYSEKTATKTVAPVGITSAERLVAAPDTFWALGGDHLVRAFDNESLALLFKADLGDVAAIDIASDSSDGIYVLGQAQGQFRIEHLGCAGNRDQTIVLEEVRDATGLVFLGISHQLVVLASERSKLHFLDARSATLVQTILVAALRPCFEITAIGSDNCSRFFIAGTDESSDGKHHVLIVDADGNLLGTIPVAATVTGIAATRSKLFLATKKGVLRFDPTTTVPQGMGDVKARVVTPQLRTGSKEPQKWIRVDARVGLPAGCSISISHASAADPDKLTKAEQALADPKSSHAQRLANWRSNVEIRTYTYHGDPRTSREVVLSAPLHDVHNELIWIEIVLIAAPGGSLPKLSELKVLYPGATLIEHLPAIYRRGELEGGDFTRALVGVLEAGSQDLDERISKLGRKIDPKFANDAWLDYVASWLGLPWDNSLTVDQKRRIVSRGPKIVAGYSTRSGLEELLECLIPGSPRRFRVTDMTAQFGFATIAGNGCEGSRLPAILAGLAATAMELGNKAVLGKARLPCGEPEPDSARLIGRIRIDIAATAEERAAWSPWMERLIETMLPATVRAQLRWLGPAEFRGDRLDEDSEIVEEAAARLGTEAITGASRLGGRLRTTLPDRLTPNSTLQ